MLLVKNDLDFEEESCSGDQNCRLIISNVTVQGVNYVFANVYMPNKVSYRHQLFFKSLQEKLNSNVSSPERRVIIGGDLTVPFDSNL